VLEPANSDCIMVPFAGPEAGTAPLTWGQKAILEDMRETGWTHNASGGHRLPAGTTIEKVAADVQRLMSSYPALRMRLSTDATGRPAQDVAASGEVGLDVMTFADDADVADVVAFTDRLWYERLLAPYELDRDWSMQTAVIRHRGASLFRVLTFHHLAVDGTAVGLLLTDMGIGGGAPRRRLSPDTIDVLELARQEQTPRLRQRGRSARPPTPRAGRVIGTGTGGSARRRPTSRCSLSPRGPGPTRPRCCSPSSRPPSLGQPASVPSRPRSL
jgi:hypothetical protein